MLQSRTKEHFMYERPVFLP